jgi:ferric-dicitrate binding protein FerR (iron transport regulator)
VKQLLGEATQDEEHDVKQWLAADPSNTAYYNQLKQVWDTSRELAAHSTVNENKAWEKFKQRIHAPVSEKKSRPVLLPWMKIAASVLLIIGLGWIGFKLLAPGQPVKELLVQTQQTVLTDTLPDGSTVTLNRASSIAYPSRFKGSTRPVILKGEAFFNVAPDKKKPFTISVNDVQVTVVGTSFNVKSHEGNTEVVVETGIVRVTKNGTTVELKAHEKIMIPAKDSIVQKEEVSDQLYQYYRTREFVCDDTPLWKLVEVLNEAYDAHIVIGRKELRELRLTTAFNNESFDQVLEVIRITFDIKVIKTGNQVILQ